ncbi:MAG: F0F1 ATP synthase subunit A [Clostridia bacterium]|nr:F0F1 ATP synthase subunit A [Clostridia bacterium]
MSDLNTELNHAMLPHEMFSIPVPFTDYKIPVTDTVVVTWIIMAVIILFAYIFTKKLSMVPQGKQNFAEVVVELVNNLVKDAVGHHWRLFAPYLGTVLLFLIVSNIVSIFNIIPNGEQLHKLTHMEIFEHFPNFALRPPTKDINVTACLAIMSILLVVIGGIRVKRLSGWLKHFLHPIPVMLPFNILDYVIKPLSLCLRLFGNILAAFIIMELIYMAFPPVVPAAFSIYFDLFDGLLQAYIFVFLTSLYVGEVVE